MENEKPRIVRELSERTTTIYTRQFSRFAAWCAQTGKEPLPTTPETVLDYLTHGVEERGWRGDTINVVKSAIAWMNTNAGYDGAAINDNETLSVFIGNIRRRNAKKAESTGARALLFDELEALIANADRDAKTNIPGRQSAGLRDGALFAIMWAGGFRRSEMVRLRVDDDFYRYDEQAKTMEFRLCGSKGSQMADVWQPVPAEYRGIEALKRLNRWVDFIQGSPSLALRISKHPHQSVFPYTDDTINEFIKVRAENIGIPPISSHSFRAGTITDAASRSVKLDVIKRHARHKSFDTTLRYVRGVDAKKDATEFAAA